MDMSSFWPQGNWNDVENPPWSSDFWNLAYSDDEAARLADGEAEWLWNRDAPSLLPPLPPLDIPSLRSLQPRRPPCDTAQPSASAQSSTVNSTSRPRATPDPRIRRAHQSIDVPYIPPDGSIFETLLDSDDSEAPDRARTDSHDEEDFPYEIAREEATAVGTSNSMSRRPHGRRGASAARLDTSNAFVDLTREESATSPPSRTSRPPSRSGLKRSAPTADPFTSTTNESSQHTSKRSKQSSIHPSSASTRAVEQIDLSRASQERVDYDSGYFFNLDDDNEAPSADAELAATLAAQQAREKETEPTQLGIGKRQCIICLDNYTNAATTACGHVFCHECLTQALKAGERNGGMVVGMGSCPVCRKLVKNAIATGGRTRADMLGITPITFMTRTAYKRSQMG